MRKLLFTAATLSFLACLLTVVSTAAAAWNCDPGICRWGYNYVGSSVNSYVTGPWNYWTIQYLDKNSGDTIQIGTGPVDGCFTNKTGSGQWSWGIPAACGSPSGYTFPFHKWISGNTSYLYAQVTTGL